MFQLVTMIIAVGFGLLISKKCRPTKKIIKNLISLFVPLVFTIVVSFLLGLNDFYVVGAYAGSLLPAMLAMIITLFISLKIKRSEL